MNTILITGGTGLVGTALTAALLERGYKVIILSRRKGETAAAGLRYGHWDPRAQVVDPDTIKCADAIVHLAGANVANGRWTPKRKQEIADSRVLSGQLLVKALREIPNQVKTVVSASAIGWYGPDPQVPNPRPFVETDGPDHSFLGKTCQQWEAAISPVTGLGKRLVTLRIGIVLSRKGGAYPEFKKPTRFGLATVLGNGRQVVSWIHITDLVNLFIEALERDTFSGIYNAVADVPVNNRQLVKTIAAAKGGLHVTLPVPAFVLKIALGEMSVEVLKSATVSNQKLKDAGFAFRYPHIREAVEELENRPE